MSPVSLNTKEPTQEHAVLNIPDTGSGFAPCLTQHSLATRHKDRENQALFVPLVTEGVGFKPLSLIVHLKLHKKFKTSSLENYLQLFLYRTQIINHVNYNSVYGPIK